MSNLVEITRALQRELGVKVDGRAGLITLGAALATIRASRMDHSEAKAGPPMISSAAEFDARTEAVMATLDPKAVPAFREFLCLAKGVAASLGCDYRMISGHRTWKEQDALFAKRPVVTKARGGYSWHNFGVAGDFGVFVGATYLDGGSPTQKTLAERVHKACSLVADGAGLAWGGNWKSIKDTPHFHMAELPDSPTAAHRKLYLAKGSVL